MAARRTFVLRQNQVGAEFKSKGANLWDGRGGGFTFRFMGVSLVLGGGV